MGRGKKRVKAKLASVETIDATPERIAKSPSYSVPVEIEKAGDRKLTTRRFLSTHLDRLWRAKRITDRQRMAGDWYRSVHFRAGLGSRVVAAYEPTIPSGQPAYGGTPATHSQAHSRKLWREAHAVLPADMRGYIDRFVLHDELPRYAGKAAARSVKQIGDALDVLADWLKMPVDNRGNFADDSSHG